MTRSAKPVRRAALLGAVASSAVCTLLVTFAAILTFVELSVANALEYAASLAGSLASTAIDPLLVEARVTLEREVEGALERKDVLDAFIADGAGVVLASSDATLLGTRVSAFSGSDGTATPPSGRKGAASGGPGLREAIRLLRVGEVAWVAPVEYAGAALGWAGVRVSLGTTSRRLANLTAVAGGAGLAAMVLAAWIGSLLAGSVSKPVEAMAANARRIARGEPPEPAPPTRIRELRELGTDLEAMSGTLAARQAALEAARDQAEAARALAESASAARTAFLENASHELRTPLNGISGLLSMLATEDPTRLERRLDELRERARVLASIVDGMMEAAQVDGELPTLADAPFPTAELVEESTRCGRSFLSGSDRELVVSAEALPATVLGDLRRIAQAIRQLLSNASRHAEAGPVELRFSWRDANLVVEVADRGPGVPPDRRGELFVPFARLEDSRRRRVGGAGLGLAIARRIARAYGGDAEVEDAPGGGALFRLRFPLRVVEAPSRTANPAADREARPGKGRILLVEDESINRLYERTLLASEGYTVDEAPDGTTALELVARVTYDLVLMDIGLPDMSGIDAATEIRKGGGRNAATPIVAVSAHDLDADRRLCAEAGMNAFVAKPIRERELLERIEAFVGA